MENPEKGKRRRLILDEGRGGRIGGKKMVRRGAVERREKDIQRLSILVVRLDVR
jgi:hypothetical protein